MNLLVVDDDERIISSLRGMVEAHFRDIGLLVYHETTLAAGLALARNRTIAVTLLDLKLPCSQDPFNTIKSIRKFNCPVVCYSGRSESELVAAATEQGAVDFIVKGTPWDKQIEKIERVVTSIQNARVQRRTVEVSDKRKGFNFSWNLNIGHVLQIAAMVIVLVGIYARFETRAGVQDWRLDQLEKAATKRDELMEKMSTNLNSLTMQQSEIVERLRNKQ